MSGTVDFDDDDLYNPPPKPVSNNSKYHRPDTVGRPGRLRRGEKRYVGNSSMPPRKTVSKKRRTFRDYE